MNSSSARDSLPATPNPKETNKENALPDNLAEEPHRESSSFKDKIVEASQAAEKDESPLKGEPTKEAKDGEPPIIIEPSKPSVVEPSKHEPSDDVSPSRYAAIASLDATEETEEERWAERTSIITKIDHDNYQSYAREILDAVVADVRTPEKKKQPR